MKTVYLLRTRFHDGDHWSTPTVYASRKRRDHDAAVARAIGGLRTYSYDEPVDAAQEVDVEDDD
jgi:hypothetical protein